MSNSQKVLALAVYSLILASAVYYFSPSKIVTVTKTEIKEVVKEVQASNTHTKTVVRTHRDGTQTTVTVADNSTNTVTDSNTETKIETSKTIERAQDGVTIAALAGVDTSNLSKGFVYGASVSKPILGPISLGAWFLTSGTIGMSVGIKF